MKEVNISPETGNDRINRPFHDSVDREKAKRRKRWRTNLTVFAVEGHSPPEHSSTLECTSFPGGLSDIFDAQREVRRLLSRR